MFEVDALDLNTLDEVDETIARSLSFIRSLKRLRNTRFVAISRLPSDILALILELIAFDEEIIWHTPWIPAHPCLYVAQVCTTWREIALALPKIWGIVYADSSKPWLKEIMRRSGSCPLFFRKARVNDRPKRDASLSLLREQGHRAKDIDIRSSQPSTVDFVFEASFPILESLTISLRAQCASFKYTGNSECLRYLFLRNCTIDVSLPCLPVLQTLIVNFSHTRAYQIPSSDTLLSTLKHLPSLRYIQLEGPIFQDMTVTATYPIIDLPHLEHLQARRVHHNFFSVLARISAPRIKTLVLELSEFCSRSSIPNVEAMVGLLPSPSANHWQVRSSIDLGSVPNSHSANISFFISVYSSRDSTAAPTVEAKIAFLVFADQACRLAATTFSLLPAAQPEFVHFDCAVWNGTFFKPLVDALADVQELRFNSFSSLCLLLEGTTEMGATSNTSNGLRDFPFPNLRRIYVVPSAQARDSAADMMKMWSPLQKILRNRLEQHPIDVLKLDDSVELSREDMKSLQALVKVEMLDREESMQAARHNSESLMAKRRAYWSEVS